MARNGLVTYSGDTIYAELRNRYRQAYLNNPNTLDPLTNTVRLLDVGLQPVFTSAAYANAAAANAAGFTRVLAAATGTQANGVDTKVFTYDGGFNLQQGLGLAPYEVTSYPSGAGNQGSNPAISIYQNRISFWSNCVDLVINTVGSATRVLVNDRYLSASALNFGAGLNFALFDFTTTGGREYRKFTIEFAGQPLRLFSVRVREFDTIWPDQVDMQIGWFGDSLATGSNSTFTGFVRVASDALGVQYATSSSIGGTGFGVGVTGTALQAQDHAFDVLRKFPPDVLVDCHNVNNQAQGFAYWKPFFDRWYYEVRASRPTLPIFVGGVMMSPDSAPTTAPQFEAAQRAYIEQLMVSDPNLFYVPIITADGGPWLYGTGFNNTGSGNRALFWNDAGAHPNTAGHYYLGRRWAQGIYKAIMYR